MTRTENLLRAVEDLFRARKLLWRTLSTSCHQGSLITLSVLARHGAMRVGALAEVLHVDVSVASRQVAELEQKAYVGRSPDPDDRRAHLVHVTDAGSEVLGAAKSDMLARVDDALADWTDEDIAGLTDGMRRLLEVFESGAPGRSPVAHDRADRAPTGRDTADTKDTAHRIPADRDAHDDSGSDDGDARPVERIHRHTHRHEGASALI